MRVFSTRSANRLDLSTPPLNSTAVGCRKLALAGNFNSNEGWEHTDATDLFAVHDYSRTGDELIEHGTTIDDAIQFLNAEAAKQPQGAVVTQWGGAARDQQEAGGAVFAAFGLALLLVFLVLAAQFESWITPAVIMLTVPLAAAGGLFGLLMAGSSLNIYSQIGLIILIGVAAKNGILIVEFANQLRDQGRSIREAIIESSSLRLRPIIMTSIATAFGALPLVLWQGAGAGTPSCGRIAGLPLGKEASLPRWRVRHGSGRPRSDLVWDFRPWE